MDALRAMILQRGKERNTALDRMAGKNTKENEHFF